jgi:hypothetical protein
MLHKKISAVYGQNAEYFVPQTPVFNPNYCPGRMGFNLQDT